MNAARVIFPTLIFFPCSYADGSGGSVGGCGARAACHIQEVEMVLTKRPNMTAKRIASSRANGRRSRGARTLEGKARAAAANLRHGFYSQSQSDILMALGEDPERFENLVDSLTETWRPANEMETRLVMRLVRALWRMDRADRIQESLTVEQLYRSMPKPTPVQIIDRLLKKKADKLLTLATELGQSGHFTRHEDFEIFDELFGDDPQKPGSDEDSIIFLMQRLEEPGTKDAWPAIDGSDPKAEGTLPRDEDFRKEDRQKLRMLLLKQLAQMQKEPLDIEGEPEDPVHSRHCWDALMAPQDRSSSIMLMQRWEDSNMRQVVRVTEMLTKMKSGKLGPAEGEK